MANTAIPDIKNKNKTDSLNTEEKNLSYRKEILKNKKKTEKEPVMGDKTLRYKSLVIDGTKYRTLLNRKFENRKGWNNPDPRKVISHIPGTVVKLFIREGQQVEKGDLILILEAMKMKSRVVFSKSGKVKAVNVTEGERVPKDFIMVELE